MIQYEVNSISQRVHEQGNVSMTISGKTNFVSYEDFKWLGRNLSILRQQTNLIINPNNNDAIKDLVLLSHCNHSIISYGTFGASAALFAGGVTYVYDLGLPLDHRGPTVAAGISNILPQWHLMT